MIYSLSRKVESLLYDCFIKIMSGKQGFVALLVRSVFSLVENVCDLVFDWMHRNDKPTILPSINNPLLLESASSIANKIRTGQVTSEKVVKMFIDRIEEINPILNCVVDNCFEMALEEAKKVDEQIRSGDKDLDTMERETPFLGVPFTIKDSFSVKGLHNTSGVFHSKDTIGSVDADVVTLMKKAGGILLAITNVPEFCMWWETNNKVYGRTRNPYNVNRNAGGSSGGEAALLCSGGSPMGIGSDMGGSVRIPASFCGIFGHKPTRHIVSVDGLHPKVGQILSDNLVAGPMSRFCVDLLLMYRVLAAENASKLKLDANVCLSKMRFFYIEDFGIPMVSQIHPDVKDAQIRVIQHIRRNFKVPVKKLMSSKLNLVGEMCWAKICSSEAPSLSELLTLNQQEQIPFLTELLKSFVGQSKYTVPFLLACVGGKLRLPKSHPMAGKMAALYDEVVRDLKELLGADGVLIVPTFPAPALYHNQAFTKPFNFANSAVFNVLGLPATQVPIGIGSWGVPIGIQVVANFYNDHLTLAVAAELERAFGGWVSPSPLNCDLNNNL